MVLGIFIFHFPGRYMLSYWLRRKKNLPYYSKKETLFCVSALCLVIQTLLPFQLSFFLCLIIKKRLSLIHFSSVRECSWYLKSCCLVLFNQSTSQNVHGLREIRQLIFFQFWSTFISSCPGCVSGSEEANSFHSELFIALKMNVNNYLICHKFWEV